MPRCTAASLGQREQRQGSSRPWPLGHPRGREEAVRHCGEPCAPSGGPAPHVRCTGGRAPA
eukprot:2725196-Alexandrium_andersonii.AAC.1